MDKYKNMFNAYRVILKEEGFMALYKGAIPRMVVVGPLFAITQCAFEAQKQYMIRNGMLQTKYALRICILLKYSLVCLSVVCLYYY